MLHFRNFPSLPRMGAELRVHDMAKEFTLFLIGAILGRQHEILERVLNKTGRLQLLF